jgi:hypothetical protein
MHCSMYNPHLACAPNHQTHTRRTTVTSHWRSKRDTAVGGVLDEQPTVDLALVQVRLLVSSIDDVRSASGLLQHTDLELATARKVDACGSRNTGELSSAGGVVDRCLAVLLLVSLIFLQWIIEDVLLSVIKLDSKILPLLIINRDPPDLLARAIQNLEVILLTSRVVNQSADLELDLVVAVIRRLVPHIEVLVRQIERAQGILLDAEMQRLDALVGRILGRVLGELQPGATEAELLLEN